MKILDKLHARQLMSEGKTIEYHCWSFSSGIMTCTHDFDSQYGSCCMDYFENLFEASNRLESYCGGRWIECECEVYP